jgi:excisionase family DNA binding protein
MNRPLDRARILILVMISASTGLWLVSFQAAAQTLEVLDIDEAAALLRVQPNIVRELAEAGRIPGRRVGDVWRFWRVALLEWLRGEPGAPAASRIHQSPLSAGELAAVSGRNAAQGSPSNQAQATSPSPQQSQPPTVGERPPTPSPEEIALRDQRVLLRKGSGAIDFSSSYGRSEQTLLPVIRVEDRTFGVSGTLRYGLLNDFQITLRVPGIRRRTAVFSDATIAGTTAPRIVRESLAGDAAVTLLGVLRRESEGMPTIVWSLDGVVPTGTGDHGFGGGLVLSKSYDPAVLFAGISYLHGLSANPSNSRLSLAKHNYGAQVGYTYAINETLALSTVMLGTYRNSRSPDGVAIPAAREHYALQLGTTWRIAQGLFLEPAVAMRLGGESPGLTFLLNVSRSFHWLRKP